MIFGTKHVSFAWVRRCLSCKGVYSVTMELALQQTNTPYVINKIRLDFGAFLWSISFLPVMGYLGIKGHLDHQKTTNNSGRCLVDKTFGGCFRKKHDIAHDQQEFVEVLLLAKCSEMLYFEGDSQPDTLKVGWFGWLKSPNLSKSPRVSISASKSLL